MVILYFNLNNLKNIFLKIIKQVSVRYIKKFCLYIIIIIVSGLGFSMNLNPSIKWDQLHLE
jgi:hypothetical protein